MQIAAYLNQSIKDRALAEALVAGFKRHGEIVDLYDTAQDTGPHSGHLAVFVGVRLTSQRVNKAARAVEQRTMLIDKGYFKRGAYNRFSIGGFQPYYLGCGNTDRRRLKELGVFVSLDPRPSTRHKVVYVEQTKKYYDFQDLGEIGAYAARICGSIQEVIDTKPELGLEIIYRPKACARKGSDYHGMPIPPPNTGYSDPDTEPYWSLFPDTQCVVIDGSNAGVEAAMAGVPVLAINGRACPLWDIVNTDFEDVLNPTVPSSDALLTRLAELSWCQYTNEEIASGFAWENLRPWVLKAA